MRRTSESTLLANSARKPTRGEVVVFVSGKGGVGKTNLALNVGILLARRGQRAILVDADLGLANADILLNISPLADFSDVLDSDRPLEDLLVRGPDGLRVLCGVSGLTRGGSPLQVNRFDFQTAVRRLQRECDTLLIDCSAGVTVPMEAFALASSLLVVVTTPEPTALADAYATLKLLCARGFAGMAGVVVNMAHSRTKARGVAGRLARTAERFLGLPIEDLGYVARDRHVPMAVRRRVPVVVKYRHCAASRCISEVSRRVAHGRGEGAVSSTVWTRVAGLFL